MAAQSSDAVSAGGPNEPPSSATSLLPSSSAGPTSSNDLLSGLDGTPTNALTLSAIPSYGGASSGITSNSRIPTHSPTSSEIPTMVMPTYSPTLSGVPSNSRMPTYLPTLSVVPSYSRMPSYLPTSRTTTSNRRIPTYLPTLSAIPSSSSYLPTSLSLTSSAVSAVPSIKKPINFSAPTASLNSSTYFPTLRMPTSLPASSVTPSYSKTLTSATSIISFETIDADRGQYSGIQEAATKVYYTQEDYEAFWATQWPGNDVPPVDFSSPRMVLVVSMGEQLTGGSDIRITSVEKKDNGGVVVKYKTTTPSPNAVVTQVLSYPYHVMSVGITDNDVIFEESHVVEAPSPSIPMYTFFLRKT